MIASPFLSRSALALGMASALTGCRSAEPAADRLARSVLTTAGTPQQALAAIESGARARGWRIVDQGPESVVVDFGTAPARLEVPSDSGLFGARTSLVDTEVHASALFVVSRTAAGAEVTMWENPVYWHPGAKAWLPLGGGVAPGTELLSAAAGRASP